MEGDTERIVDVTLVVWWGSTLEVNMGIQGNVAGVLCRLRFLKWAIIQDHMQSMYDTHVILYEPSMNIDGPCICI